MARRPRAVVHHEWECPKCGYRYHSDRGCKKVTHQHKTSRTTAEIVDLRPVEPPPLTLFEVRA